MKRILLALVTLLCFSLSALATVNINTATQADLESLDGIGPVKAKAIIDYRKKNGNFKNIEDLDKVDGIGPVTLKNIRKDILINGAKTPAPLPADRKVAQAVKVDKPKKVVVNQKPAIVEKSTKDTKHVAKVAEPSKASTQKKLQKKSTARKNKLSKTKKAIKVKAK